MAAHEKTPREHTCNEMALPRDCEPKGKGDQAESCHGAAKVTAHGRHTGTDTRPHSGRGVGRFTPGMPIKKPGRSALHQVRIGPSGSVTLQRGRGNRAVYPPLHEDQGQVVPALGGQPV